ncbi:protein IMPACT isoform X2 [Callorhinchus milii]|uniref:protein IMPACT isoform X2 n=1 Tax=Callorhinchus milii TaxID=7868 RepID=UPI0004571DF5|nr:protein IMPACT isoform X2 [Callorhinchus milii]XP_042202684.1 protein IMPACT isoform X2 [Callorhinchus milii]XP_042202688.1 protein IMPACT isoform X2 [Callorhinchus milii]|eukprot:gi/632955074/ref/XP_007893290.1/ PREDICTED: protein IMPACT [Callorhinchus milii]
MAAETEEEENLQKQIDEIEALSSIFEDEWCVIDEASRIFCIRIADKTENPKWTLCLQVMLPPEYPTAAPPVYQLNAAWLRGQERTELSNSLEEIYLQNLGESILFLWVEKIKDVLVVKSQTSDPVPEMKKTTEELEVDYEDEYVIASLAQQNATKIALPESSDGEQLPSIVHGEPITDRRSTFQAHLAPVVTTGQVKMVLCKLYQNKKIASATHNIYSYRIYCEDKQTFLQDCEDDGETAAGGRLLHLMQILDVRNVMVVVSRWYGGILLGPDRFKHINNSARNILVNEGYSETVDGTSKTAMKSKKQKGKKEK